jgi:hypothetical protein
MDSGTDLCVSFPPVSFQQLAQRTMQIIERFGRMRSPVTRPEPPPESGFQSADP